MAGKIEVTDVNVTRITDDGRAFKALATIVLNDGFAVRGVKIINGAQQGLFVAMPDAPRADGVHRDVCHPINTETRAEITEKVLAAYHAARVRSARRGTTK